MEGRVKPFAVELEKRWTNRWLLKMRPIYRPETSVLNHLTPRNNPKDGRIKPYAFLCGQESAKKS
jgi:hypothetical protein